MTLCGWVGNARRVSHRPYREDEDQIGKVRLADVVLSTA
jgi:hypothetical protein